MLSTDKLESQKIAKYAYRLNKSFRNLNLIKSNEYLLHLKHYIQKGGNQSLTEQMNIIAKISETINKPENKNDYNIPTIKANCVKNIKDLEDKIKDLENKLNIKIKDHDILTAENLQNVTDHDKLKKLIDELKENIKKMEEEIDTLNKKLIDLLADETLSEEDKKDKNKLLDKIGEKIKNCNDYKKKSEELPKLLKELADEQDKVRELDKKIEENNKFNTALATNLSQLLLQLLTGFLGEEDAKKFINEYGIVKVETPKVVAPKVEETPIVAPKVEETPTVVAPKVETPKVETPKVEEMPILTELESDKSKSDSNRDKEFCNKTLQQILTTKNISNNTEISEIELNDIILEVRKVMPTLPDKKIRTCLKNYFSISIKKENP